jgi:hypothetical protein
LQSAAFLVTAGLAQETTIRVPLSTEEFDEVTFDASRLPRDDVSRWIQLSEDGPFSQAELSGTGLCSTQPPSQGETKQKEIERARDRQSKFRKHISKMDESHYPEELKDIFAYLKRRQSFWLWLDTQELAFFETGDIDLLQTPFEQIDPNSNCAAVLEGIRHAKDRNAAWHLACYDWHTCMIKAGEVRIGPYPRDAWSSFLTAYGIRERIRSTEPY